MWFFSYVDEGNGKGMRGWSGLLVGPAYHFLSLKRRARELSQDIHVSQKDESPSLPRCWVHASLSILDVGSHFHGSRVPRRLHCLAPPPSPQAHCLSYVWPRKCIWSGAKSKLDNLSPPIYLHVPLDNVFFLSNAFGQCKLHMHLRILYQLGLA
jgi:hypothetical protein